LTTTGLAPNAAEYRRRLEGLEDSQLDSWSSELLRDLSIRRGVRHALRALRSVTGLDEAGIERVFALGGGAPATAGRTVDGELMVPAIELWCLVPGLRRELPGDARAQLVEFLVANFHEIVYT
jgi:hypothetical protein